jgi:hypothetical protein
MYTRTFPRQIFPFLINLSFFLCFFFHRFLAYF